MTGMNNKDYQLFTAIARMKQENLLKNLKNFLKKYYNKDKIKITGKNILCEGNCPIMLVAHMDTVFRNPPEKIYHDQTQNVIWSPQGLGADDRAGVFAIIKIIQKGYRPHICFTSDEESGGVGATFLTEKIPTAPFDIKYIVELDRQGSHDCVFYSCANEEFEVFIEKYGFATDWGTFSDISIICPAWKIAGVNLSIGYINEHSERETLHTEALYLTIKKVQKMIDEIEDAPAFKYIFSPYDLYWNRMGKAYGWGYPMEYDDEDYAYGYNNYNYTAGPYICAKCHRGFCEDDVFLVKSKDEKGKKVYYCVDCVGTNINWCESCGEAFEVKQPNEILCQDCIDKKFKTPSIAVM